MNKKQTVIQIDSLLLDQVSQAAKESYRDRMHHNIHEHYHERVQRLLNAIEPGSYIRPHRHLSPPKNELFLILRGKGAVITFNYLGDVDQVLPLDAQLGKWGVDIPSGIYHTILSLEKGTVFLEIKPGPFQPKTTGGFAPWAPDVDSDDIQDYYRHLETLATEAFSEENVSLYGETEVITDDPGVFVL